MKVVRDLIGSDLFHLLMIFGVNHDPSKFSFLALELEEFFAAGALEVEDLGVVIQAIQIVACACRSISILLEPGLGHDPCHLGPLLGSTFGWREGDPL